MGPGSPHTVLPTVPTQRCFGGNGTEYRGVASTAASGLSCLAWNSDLLYQELHVDSVGAAALLGLGPHAYCRSAQAWPAPGHLIQGGQGLSWGQKSGPRGPRPRCPSAESAKRCWEGAGVSGAPACRVLPFPPAPAHPPLRAPQEPRQGREALVLRGEGQRALLGVLPPAGLRCANVQQGAAWPHSHGGHSHFPCGLPSLEDHCPL